MSKEVFSDGLSAQELFSSGEGLTYKYVRYWRIIPFRCPTKIYYSFKTYVFVFLNNCSKV